MSRRSMIGLLALATLLITLSACGDSSLEGTTWKGANPVGDEVLLTFTSATECTFGAIGPGKYSVEGNTVTVTAGGHTYNFTRLDDSMTSGELKLHKQREKRR